MASFAQILDYETRSIPARLLVKIGLPAWADRMIGRYIGRRARRKYERYQWSLDNSKYVREHKSLFDAIDKSKAMKKAGILTKSGHFKKR